MDSECLVCGVAMVASEGILCTGCRARHAMSHGTLTAMWTEECLRSVGLGLVEDDDLPTFGADDTADDLPMGEADQVEEPVEIG